MADTAAPAYPETRAVLRYSHVSPTKVRQVLGLIRGIDVDEARDRLRFCERGPAEPVRKLLDSAVANAEHNNNLPPDELYVVRAWADDQPLGGAGWIGALTDTMLARALSAMHGDLGRAWDVDELARAAATSRVTLGRRFAAAIGEPPLSYLTRARMQQAAQRIRSSDAALGEIAGEVGYHSEFAFNRAFRRVFGVPPGAYRRRQRTPATSSPS